MLIAAAFLAGTLAFPSGTGLATDLVKRLEARYRSAQTLQATFLERYSENGRLLRSQSGTAYFRRPGKMRWEYEVPERNLFLVDGKTSWFYVPEDHTVTRIPAKQSTDIRTPMALLAGEMKIAKICAQVEIAAGERPDTAGDVTLRCQLRGTGENREVANRGSASSEPRPDTGADIVFFEVEPESGELTRIVIRQSDGVELEFKFRNWRFDPPLESSMFRFSVPRGVAIVNGESQTGESPEKWQ